MKLFRGIVQPRGARMTYRRDGIDCVNQSPEIYSVLNDVVKYIDERLSFVTLTQGLSRWGTGKYPLSCPLTARVPELQILTQTQLCMDLYLLCLLSRMNLSSKTNRLYFMNN